MYVTHDKLTIKNKLSKSYLYCLRIIFWKIFFCFKFFNELSINRIKYFFEY